MKAFALISGVAMVLTSSHAALANCSFEDYQRINRAVSGYQIKQGAEFKGEVLDVMSQEMGPVCKQVPESLKIPGIAYYHYQVIAASAGYDIQIVESEDGPGPSNRASIFKVVITD